MSFKKLRRNVYGSSKFYLNSKLKQLTYGARRRQFCSIINNVDVGREHHKAQSPECYIFKRNFRTNKGLLQHLNTCRRKNNTVPNVEVNIDNESAVVQEDLTRQDRERKTFYWNTVPRSVYQEDLEEAYEQIVYWRKNVFMVPTSTSGKKFFNKTTIHFDQWTNDTPLKSIAFKAIINVMPDLLQQKPSRKSKAPGHLIPLLRRLKLWDGGNINELLDESKKIQERLPSTNTAMNLQKIPMKFKHLMQNGNVNEALKLLANNMSNRILPLADETLYLLPLNIQKCKALMRKFTARTNTINSSCRLQSY